MKLNWRWAVTVAVGLCVGVSAGCTMYNEDQPRQRADDRPVYRRDDPRSDYRSDPRSDYRPATPEPDPYTYRNDPPPVYHPHDDDWNRDRASDAELDDSWTFLGRRVVDFKGDHDAIKVGSKFGRFRVLKFIVRNGELDVFNFIIRVGDKDVYKPDIRQHYDQNTASRTVDLPGDQRTVQRVDSRTEAQTGEMGGRSFRFTENESPDHAGVGTIRRGRRRSSGKAISQAKPTAGSGA